jgi:hypothetical protein
MHDLAEDTDDLTARVQRDGADLDADPVAVVLQQRHLLVRRLDVAEDLLCEGLPRASRVLRCDHGGELPSDHVADHALRGRVDPADDPVGVDHVGGHVDLVERTLDVSVHRPKPGHRAECLSGSRGSHRPNRTT